MDITDKSMRIFTLCHGDVKPYAVVQSFKLSSGDEIPAIIVGEQGRGRELGVLPVAGLKTSPDKKTQIEYARVGTSRSGKPKLIAATSAETDESAIVVFRTDIGFRGSCGHDGDIVRYDLTKNWWGQEEIVPVFDPFPGKILVEGIIAQGDAGRMGRGSQIIAVVPKGAPFSEWRSGRLYGAPGRYYYCFNGSRILAATKQERELLPDEHPLAWPALAVPEMDEESA